ncbi:hypothetical protein B7494_g4675 [Chlorociboria aeruginascens]|nr:hypothetical protein B7494_g4675 [Chlorociboria aeruginascens]
MPLMETVTIINKSGKVVSTGKHLVNIFKDAKDAYNEKKAELRYESQLRIEQKAAQKLLRAREESASVSSHRSHRSKSHHREHRSKEKSVVTRPPLTADNLSRVSESVVSQRPKTSHNTPVGDISRSYHSPYIETAVDTYFEPHPTLPRRYTDFPDEHMIARRPVAGTPTLYRSTSVPDLHGENIDMNLAYGELPPPLPSTANQEIEFASTLSKLDTLLLEAQCLHHSAVQIISNLQKNPEAMAAVALTLAELSSLITKMGPGILTALKAGSPAVFALLISPQFLIAGGVMVGVTVVMLGGYKIVRKLVQDGREKKEAMGVDANNNGHEGGVEEALVYEGSIESWRRGVEFDGAQMPGEESVDGEFITPEAARQKRERRREGKGRSRSGSVAGSERSERSRRSERSHRSHRTESTARETDRESSIRRKAVPIQSSSLVTGSEGGSLRSEKGEKGEKKKGEALMVTLFKKKMRKNKEAKEGKKEKIHRAKLLEV